MANIIREALNADQMRLPLFTGGMSAVGFGLSGTWTGSVAFRFSNDGIRFFPLSVTPFASGTAVQAATANGNYFSPVLNFVAVDVVFTRLTGTLIATLATSIDSSWQDAFLASTSKYVNSVATGATNTITIAAQANRAWRLRTLSVGVQSTATWASNPVLKITDGASSILWASDIATTAGVTNMPLPADSNTPGLSGGGVVNTPGNTLVITLASGGGSVQTNLNAEIVAA